MTTGLDIVTRALQRVGALTKDETPSSDEANDAFSALNDILASWSNDAGTVYARTLESFTLTGGDGTYTIGSGADFNTTRPIKIIKAYIRNSNVDYELEIVTDEDFAGLTFKSITGRPDFLNYDNGYATGTIKLYPVPDSAYTLFLLSEKPLSSVSSLSSDITFPPGWVRALINNLAVEISPEYGQTVTPELAGIAQESKRAIMTAVRKNKTLDVPRNLDINRNIYAGYYN